MVFFVPHYTFFFPPKYTFDPIYLFIQVWKNKKNGEGKGRMGMEAAGYAAGIGWVFSFLPIGLSTMSKTLGAGPILGHTLPFRIQIQ